MTRRYLLLAWALALTAAAAVMNVVQPDEITGLVLPAALMAMLGAVLRVRVPGSPVPGALVVGGSAWLVYDVARRYATLGDVPGDYVAAWLGSWTGALLPLSLAALLVVYPGGIRNRLGWVVATALVTLVGSVAVGAVLLWGLPAEVLNSPDALDRHAEYRPVDLAFLLGFVTTIPAIGSLALRFRRGTQLERQQIKVLLAAAVLFGLVFVTLAATEEIEARSWIMGGAISLLPLGVAVAVARYRLYEIDRIVSRTVTYGMVAGVLAAAYAAIVAAFTALLPAQSSLAVAAATLAVAALFNPARRRIQAAVERRFNRAKYDAQRVVDEFTAALRDRVDPDEVVAGWVATVRRVLEPATVSVWTRPT